MENNQQNTALLVMDMQMGILSRYPDAGSIAERTAKAIAHARNNNIPVIYVVVGFRKGMPEVSANNKMFSTLRTAMASVDMAEWMKVMPALAPQDGEPIVIKRRVSAFAGSDLEVILRGLNVSHMVLCGIATSGVVLSTLREASDKDFKLTVLADCCADADEEVHRVLTTKVFLRQADVMNAEEWVKK